MRVDKQRHPKNKVIMSEDQNLALERVQPSSEHVESIHEQTARETEIQRNDLH